MSSPLPFIAIGGLSISIVIVIVVFFVVMNNSKTKSATGTDSTGSTGTGSTGTGTGTGSTGTGTGTGSTGTVSPVPAYDCLLKSTGALVGTVGQQGMCDSWVSACGNGGGCAHTYTPPAATTEVPKKPVTPPTVVSKVLNKLWGKNVDSSDSKYVKVPGINAGIDLAGTKRMESKDVSKLKGWCDADPNCKYFSTNGSTGWSKPVLESICNYETQKKDATFNTWVKKSEFAKLKETCGSMWGKAVDATNSKYIQIKTLNSGINHPNTTRFNTADKQKLMDECDKSVDCTYFAANQTAGWIKKAPASTICTPATSERNSDFSTWVKKAEFDKLPATCGSQPIKVSAAFQKSYFPTSTTPVAVTFFNKVIPGQASSSISAPRPVVI